MVSILPLSITLSVLQWKLYHIYKGSWSCRKVIWQVTILSFLLKHVSQNCWMLSLRVSSDIDVTIDREYLTIIGRGWAKYRNLLAASWWIICRSRRLRQITDRRDADKLRYFAIYTEFNNCFITRSPSLFSYFNHFLVAQWSDQSFFSRERGSSYAWAEYYLQQNTLRRYYAWADHYL